ncbi:MAG TPA: hypothetical protein VG983_05800 [Caulobacterales bacterium]|nr:hypothetical protein [Caulobacterales bacterium]
MRGDDGPKRSAALEPVDEQAVIKRARAQQQRAVLCAIARDRQRRRAEGVRDRLRGDAPGEVLDVGLGEKERRAVQNDGQRERERADKRASGWRAEAREDGLQIPVGRRLGVHAAVAVACWASCGSRST